MKKFKVIDYNGALSIIDAHYFSFDIANKDYINFWNHEKDQEMDCVASFKLPQSIINTTNDN